MYGCQELTSVPGLYDARSMHHFAQGKSFDDSEPYLGNSKHASRTPVTLETNVSKSLAADNVKASNAAKIKVKVWLFDSVQSFIIQLCSY